MDCTVINTWTNKVVFSGTKHDCIKYLNGNNTYQSNYSKLKFVSSLENVAEKLKGRELFPDKIERAKASLSENKEAFLKLVDRHDPSTMEAVKYRIENRDRLRKEQDDILQQLIIDDRDKTKEYKIDYETYSIITFWKEETKSIQAGWMHKVINK